MDLSFEEYGENENNFINKPNNLVNHPKHYNNNGIETIDVIEAYNLNFNLGNVIKYVLRSDLKGNKIQDLEKALWYLKREIEKNGKCR